MKQYLTCLILFIITQNAFTQPLPIIKANSKVVDILDGNDFQKGNWNISPEVKPDIYNVSRFRRTKRVAFYTDIDSISFMVEPENEYKFIILLNGKDSACTTISTSATHTVSCKRINENTTNGSDTIPFILGKGSKIYFKGKINNSDWLNFMFDTGSDQEVISKEGLSKNVKINFNDTKSSVSIGGTTSVQNSKTNQLEIGNLLWDNISIVKIDGADADGIIGYNVFDNKVVEINYDKKILIVHSQPIEVDKSYEELSMVFKGNLPFIEAVLTNGSQVTKGYFEFDAGSNGSLWIDKAFATENNLYGAMKKIGETSSWGFDGNRINNETVLLPRLSFGNLALTNVPVDLELQSNANNNFKWGILGMDVLKRFNVVLDFKNDKVYLKANSLTTLPFNKPLNKYFVWGGIAIIVLLILTAFFVYRKRRTLKH